MGLAARLTTSASAADYPSGVTLFRHDELPQTVLLACGLVKQARSVASTCAGVVDEGRMKPGQDRKHQDQRGSQLQSPRSRRATHEANAQPPVGDKANHFTGPPLDFVFVNSRPCQ